MEPPKSLKLDQKHSHSSGEIDDPNSIIEHREIDRCSSDFEMQKNISQSQSDSGLKQRLTSVASPVSELNIFKLVVIIIFQVSTAKELFSPLSKFAKGVQTFGANLDPRKLSGQVRQISPREMEEHKKLQEKWANSKCRLIAL